MHKIKVDVYKIEIGVLIGKKEDAVKRLTEYDKVGAAWLKEQSRINGATMSHGITPFMWLSEVTPGTVAHEAVHAASIVLQSRGIDIASSGEEPLAYMVEYITREIYRIHKKL